MRKLAEVQSWDTFLHVIDGDVTQRKRDWIKLEHTFLPLEALCIFRTLLVVMRSFVLELLEKLILDESLPNAHVLTLQDRLIRTQVSDVLLKCYVLLVNHKLLENGKVQNVFYQGLTDRVLTSHARLTPNISEIRK